MSQWIDLELERQILATLVMSSPRLDVSLLKGEYFSNQAHRTIFQHIHKLWLNDEPIDLISVNKALKDSGIADYIGGDMTLHQLVKFLVDNHMHTSEDRHSKVLRDLWQRRQIEQLLATATKKLDDGTPAQEIVTAFDQSVFHVLENASDTTHMDKRKELEDSLNAILNPAPDDCIPTPWPSLNTMIGGYRGEEMIVFAGRPGMGKTAMMCTAQLDLAKRGIASLAFSMDMGRRQLWNRYFSQTASVPVNQLEKGQQLEQEVIDRLHAAKDELVDLPFWVDPYPYRTLTDIRTIIRQSVLRYGIKVVFLDHIGKIKPEKSETRQEEVSKMAQGLKAMAKEFSIAIVALVQLNRMVEQRADKRPMMSDLRESGTIEQEADIILLAHRPEYYNMDTFPNGLSSAGKVEIIGSKVRNGEAGSRVLDFEGEYTRIIERSNGSDLVLPYAPHNVLAAAPASLPFATAFGL